ncbi:MAG: ACT domain-containing protein [Clostridia bacterium]|nr:ACT domain-containing protein [Clostridia bacterium]
MVGYLGPEGSYSHLAAKKLRPDGALKAYQSFPLAMQALEGGAVDEIVLPIENSLNGGVAQNMDLLNSRPVCAVEHCVVAIDHRLATLEGCRPENIKRVYSHAQALEQCAKYLLENFPEAKLIATQSTAASLEMLKSESDACIVGSHVKAEGVQLSDKNVSDEPNNFTHFLLVRRGEIGSGAKSQKVYFSLTLKNLSGALASVLQPVKEHGINMTKIESRPVKNVPDEYAFFIEIEGDYSTEKIKSALNGIKSLAKSFKILGCY